MTMTTNKKIIVEYTGSVKTTAGWRSVMYKAEAEKVSDKRAKILKIISIDGKDVIPFMSRTKAKRQQFNALYFAQNEENKIKNISSLNITE